MDEDEYETFEVPVHANKLRGIDLLILVLGTIETFFEGLTGMLMSHANWKVSRVHMQEQARAEIERMVSGE